MPVPILDHDDDVHTGDREFTLQLSKVTVAAIGTDSATVTIRDDEPQPLIARFTNLPEGNHGQTSFNFDISFNQDVATQNLAMQNDVMTVTNGEITSAGRVSGQSRLWRITVQPVDGRDVTVELPATTGCSATGAVCTSGDDPQPLSNSITHTFKGTRLSARFGHHSHHNGADAFTVGLRFSEEPDTTAEELQDHAITTQGGSITSVIAKNDGSRRAWTITVQPNGLGNVVISLKPPKNCDTGGHIYTGGGELLSNGLINTVHGPVQLTVSDAAATEGDDESLTFTVTPNKETLDKFYVSYATSDGTATAGEDYTAVSGVLAYTYGEDPPTVTVPVLNDEDAEDAETVILTLSDPSLYVHIADGEATGTILDGAQEPATPNSPATGLPSITGTPKAGEPLTADTSAIVDADGLANVSYSYQWVRATGGQDADIAGAAGSTYTPDNNDVDKTLKVRVSFEDDVGNDESLTSLPTAAVARSADGTVWSADMLVVEYTEISIGAATADLFSNIGGSSNLQIKSLWSYVPDQDLRLAFTDTFDDAGDHTLIVGDFTLEFPAGSSGEQSFKWTNVGPDWEDGQTIAVRIVPTTPAEPVANTAATGEPTISGTAQVGQRLTADTSAISDADGLNNVSYNYQWLASDANIQHATGSSHTLIDSDEGQTIKVRVSFTDDRGNAESLTSEATAAVDPRPNRPASGAPSIQGVLQDQQALTADSVGIADADGLDDATFSYQWIFVSDSDAADVASATGPPTPSRRTTSATASSSRSVSPTTGEPPSQSPAPFLRP